MRKMNEVVISFVFLLFFFSQFMYVRDGHILLQFFNMLIGLISFAYIYKYMSARSFIYLLLMVFFSTFTTIVSEKYKLGDIAFSLLMPLFGFFIVLYRDRLVIPALLFCVATIIYCGRAILLGLDLNTELFSFSSRNYISVLAIFSFFVVYISCRSENFKLLLFSGVFFVVLFSNSRSAVFSFSVVLIGMLYSAWSRNIVVSLVFGVVGVVGLSYVVIFYGNDIYNYSYDMLGIVRRLSVGGLGDSGRLNVINCYYSEFGFDSFLLGLDAFDGNVCRFLANGSDNPHNSFIKMYANLGLYSFIVISLIISSAVSLFKRKEFVLLSFLFCFLIRASTDIIFFFQSWDAYLFAIFVIAMPRFFLNESGVMKISDYNSRG